MANTVESVLDRVTHITKDYDKVRFTDLEFIAWANDAQDQIASLHMRAADRYVTLALAAGARQDLRVIDPTVRWLRLQELTCNVERGQPTGSAIRQVARPILDAAFRNWRSRTGVSTEVKEYAVDEREAFTFDVYPPAAAGTQVYALAGVKPDRITGTTGPLSLADGFDIPMVDYILFRFFSKDANDPTYVSRAQGHMQLFLNGLGVETKDAKPE